MTFELLARCPEHAETVADWLCGEWGDSTPQSRNQLANALRARMSEEFLPMHLLALDAGEVVGFVALKLHEMDSYPDREHWLGSLFVPGPERGRGIGGALIEEVILRSKVYGVTLLSLQTKRLDGGLYRRYGWEEVERTHSKGGRVLVMEREIDQGTTSRSTATT